MRTTKLLHLVWLSACLLFTAAPGQAENQTQRDAGESISGFSFALVEDSSHRSIVEGSQADMVSENMMKMTDVVCSIYQNSEQTLAIATPQAQADTEKSIVTSDKKVIFTNPKGMNINGTGMYWDTKSQTIKILKNIDSVFPSTMFAEDAPNDQK